MKPCLTWSITKTHKTRGKCIPRLEDLIEGRVAERKTQDEEVDKKKGKIIKFGWMEGVLMRCLLNIWGVSAVLEADLGGGSGRYLAGHAGDHPVQRGHLVVGLVPVSHL